MSLRKAAGLLAAFGLMIGLIGGGVGAVFSDQVTAEENISVGTFECLIVEPSDGVIAGDQKSVSYDAPPITSSAPGSAPFSFTVENTGSIDALLTVSTSPVSAPFAIIGAPIGPVPLVAGATHTFATGIEWGELSNANEGTSGTVTWTVDCGEFVEVQSSVLEYGPTGWGGWSCPAGTTVASASILNVGTGDGDVASLTLWKPGASVDGVSYPSTPFGYTYTPPEEGAIAQNDNDSDSLKIVLLCQP